MSRIAPESPLPTRETAPATSRVADINQEFLRLLTHPELPPDGPALGLSPAVLQGLRQLVPAAIGRLAAAPVLLVEFCPLPGVPGDPIPVFAGVAERDPASRWQAECRAFADRLLTCLWHAVSSDRTELGLSIGLDSDATRQLRELSFGGIRRYRDHAAWALRARLAAHPRCWQDLIHAAGSGNPERLLAAHLSLIPLCVAERHPPRLIPRGGRA